MADPLSLETAGEIRSRIQVVDGLIQEYLASPAKFASVNAGSAQISLPEYIAALREERRFLTDKLSKLPFWVQSELEGTQ